MYFVFSVLGFVLAFVLTAWLESIGIRTGKLVSTLVLAVGLFGFPPLAIRVWSSTPRAKSRLVCDSLLTATYEFLAAADIPITEQSVAYVWLVFFFDAKWHLDYYSNALAGRTFLCFTDLMIRKHSGSVNRPLYESGMYRRYDLIEEDMRVRRNPDRFPEPVAVALDLDYHSESLHAHYYRFSTKATDLVLKDLR